MAFLQDSQPDLCLLAKSGGCSVYQLRNESGEGTMTVYEVFPGATILYNDFHMAYCDSSFETQQDLLCIDYCREGRMEYAVGNDAFSYMATMEGLLTWPVFGVIVLSILVGSVLGSLLGMKLMRKHFVKAGLAQ